jgi:hypothetical protein
LCTAIKHLTIMHCCAALLYNITTSGHMYCSQCVLPHRSLLLYRLWLYCCVCAASLVLVLLVLHYQHIIRLYVLLLMCIAQQASAIGLMTDIQAALSPGTNPPATDKPDSSSSSSSSSGSSNASTKAALLRSLPPFGSVRGLVNFPPEYLPILQQPRAVSPGLVIHHTSVRQSE